IHHPLFFLLSLTRAASTLFPYTTLFRSNGRAAAAAKPGDVLPRRRRDAGGHGLDDAEAAEEHRVASVRADPWRLDGPRSPRRSRSEEHTSELQSPDHLVCRLLLEKKTQH